MGFDWCCGQVGSGHKSSKVKYMLKESLGEQSSYFVYFQTYNVSKAENGFGCLLLQMLNSPVSCENTHLIIPLLNCKQGLSFLSHSYQTAGGKTQVTGVGSASVLE